MRNWWTTLYHAKERGWATFSEISDTIPEGTTALELEQALDVVQSLNISFVSNVEGQPVEQNVREMLEWQKQYSDPEFFHEDTEVTEDSQQEQSG